MKIEWSNAWKASKNPAKQRKYRYKAPLHVKQKLMHVHLSPELRKKYDKRQLLVRKGDTVAILRGQHKKKKGTVSRVSLKQEQVFVEGIDRAKRDGNVTLVPMKASNLMIIVLYGEDKKRNAKLKPKTQPKEKK
jgi:large subunit ribosomal protein L24